jgi:hypothetical protein
METIKIDKKILQKSNLRRFINQTGKEVKMSTKSLLRVVLSAGLLVLILLGAEVISNASSKGSTSDGPMTKVRLAGSDYIERHPEIARPANYYIGSDYIERHPEVARPANYYIGSDYIERHPEVTRPVNYYLGSDYSERHPQDPYTGSDWIERHPSQPTP